MFKKIIFIFIWITTATLSHGKGSQLLEVDVPKRDNACKTDPPKTSEINDPRSCGHWNIDQGNDSALISKLPFPATYQICRELNNINMAAHLLVYIDGNASKTTQYNLSSNTQHESAIASHLSPSHCVIVSGRKISIVVNGEVDNKETFYGTFEPIDLGMNQPDDTNIRFVNYTWAINSILIPGNDELKTATVLNIDKPTLVRFCRGKTGKNSKIKLGAVVDGQTIFMNGPFVSGEERRSKPLTVSLDSCFSIVARNLVTYASGSGDQTKTTTINGVVGFLH